ncbi:MAG: UDP-2,4-diacetamido-2,4,6-trideoxy-beta-L-altropyranose hydrolase [Pseudomonadota bacterium]
MHVFFRTDASLVIGHGHVMRCLTLAAALREDGITCVFVCREHQGHLCQFIEDRGFTLVRLPLADSPPSREATPVHSAWLGATWAEDAAQTREAISRAGVRPGWMIVDHYALDSRWESTLRPHVARIMAIDDIADRTHDADVLLDQNFYPDMDARYSSRVGPGCNRLLGPRYALLRNEFSGLRKTSRVRRGPVRRVMVFFGGSDVTNETGKALDAMALLGMPEVEFEVVIGNTNPNKDVLVSRCDGLSKVRLYCQVANMAEMMVRSDLAIGAAGTATWERCALGLPALMLAVADNQVAIAEGVDQVGAQRYLGESSVVSAAALALAMSQVIRSPQLLAGMSQKAMNLVDALGAARVATALKEFA